MMEKFVYFWNGEFSQWHIAPMQIDGVEYNCCEQYMMACKAKLFGDDTTLSKIMQSESPREQKKLGRQVQNFDLKIWEMEAKQIVYRGNQEKFLQHKQLFDKLMDTDGTLVEASPYDCIWGIGLSADDPKAKNRATWRGKNWLGEVLTQVRDDLRSKNRAFQEAAAQDVASGI